MMSDPMVPFLTLNLPAGDYAIEGMVDLSNHADFFLQDNSRRVQCDVTTSLANSSVFNWPNIYVVGTALYLDPPGGNHSSFEHATFNTLARFPQDTTVYLSCRVGNETDPNHVQVKILEGELTAIRMGSVTRQ